MNFCPTKLYRISGNSFWSCPSRLLPEGGTVKVESLQLAALHKDHQRSHLFHKEWLAACAVGLLAYQSTCFGNNRIEVFPWRSNHATDVSHGLAANVGNLIPVPVSEVVGRVIPFGFSLKLRQ